jgi:hypothetical protein
MLAPSKAIPLGLLTTAKVPRLVPSLARNLVTALLSWFVTQRNKWDVGVKTNYLSHAANSVISSSLAIRFTEDVVIPKNRATDKKGDVGSKAH